MNCKYGTSDYYSRIINTHLKPYFKSMKLKRNIRLKDYII
ncbi:hypothetical protein [Clostridium cuniculi]